MADLILGKVPHPDFVDAIVTRRWQSAGLVRVPSRGPELVGTCRHSWGRSACTSSAQRSIFDLFSPGGERRHDALVDESL